MPGYDLIPKLRSLRIPTLVIAGEHDFIPVEIAEHVADLATTSALPEEPEEARVEEWVLDAYRRRWTL